MTDSKHLSIPTPAALRSAGWFHPTSWVGRGRLAAGLLLLLLAACQSGPVTIEEHLSPAEYFQRAQEAAQDRNYDLAMRYYETFQQVHPGDLERNLWARYEIAFLYHKMGDDERAMALLDELLESYRTEGTDDWPQAPRLLAERVQESIREGRPTAAPGGDIPPAAPATPAPAS